MSDRDWIARAYIEPIRSVLFVDDQFPTYSVPDNGTESVRARALWDACRARGWLCDIDNQIEWDSEAQKKRLLASDLLVLDYHLDGSSPEHALRMIASLAASPLPDLVVIYTAESDLDSVLLSAAVFARGGVQQHSLEDMPDEYEDLEDELDWSLPALLAYCRGANSWVSEFEEACQVAGIAAPSHEFGGRLLERALRKRTSASTVSEVRRIEAIDSKEQRRWFQCGNLFVVVVGKRLDAGESGASEAEELIRSLEQAVRAWDPPRLACMIAESRHEVHSGAFRDDLVLPSDELRSGLVYYVRSETDEEERKRRSRHVAADLLQRRYDRAVQRMSARLLEVVAEDEGARPSEDALLLANAFLCSEGHDRHHLRLGSVFRSHDSKEFWLCVTPACDMVPRERKPETDPWRASLGEVLPFTAVRLELCASEKDVKAALKSAFQARCIFFEDHSVVGTRKAIAARVFASSNDPNPKVEQLLAENRGCKDASGVVSILQIMREKDEVVLRRRKCDVVAQLRAPFAERISSIVGAHLSRIGVDFLT